MSSPVRILAGMVAGTAAGLFVRAAIPPELRVFGFSVLEGLTTVAYAAGQVFLRLIFMTVVPLVVSSLVLGTFELGDVRRLGRIGLRCLMFTCILSLTSVMVGIGMVEMIRPGERVEESVREQLKRDMGSKDAKKHVENAGQAKSVVDTALSLLSRNPLRSAVDALEGEMIALMLFSLICGVALTMVEPEKSKPLVRLAESVLAVSMKIIDFAMALAPFGVAGLLFQLVVKTGAGLLASLAGYIFCVVGGLAIQQFVVYGSMLALFGKIRPIEFFRKTQEAALTAFSTASSAATLPTSLRIAEEELKIPRRVGTFVLTVGATANQNGTALFEGVTVLFLAQVFGIVLTFQQQVAVVVMSVMAGVGTAGVPGGSLPLIVLVLQGVGVPAEGIGIVLGVDRLLDMCRTTLNVTGDLVIAQLVAVREPVEKEDAAGAMPAAE